MINLRYNIELSSSIDKMINIILKSNDFENLNYNLMKAIFME
ncbi:MAG: hypothetical protein QM535_13240 [Limnohabitans sp.]|nr:hypothetical protein [Limnohabitans sp.]